MKIDYRKFLIVTIFFFSVMLLSCFAFTRIFPKAPARWQTAAVSSAKSDTKEVINYTALGDSLTEGIGDITNQGGFVNLLANDVKDHYRFNAVGTENYGVAGERSDQIIKRLKKDEDLQKSLSNADFITITVGGNDLMKVFQNNFFKLTVKKFDKPVKDYQKRLKELFELIREQNPEAPIYVLGIYNPYYLNFPEITDLQTIFDNWNEGTNAIVDEQENSFFIPINDLLYQGINGNIGIENTEETTDSSAPSKESDLSAVTNNALYEGDSFHPNNLGYQLMANAVKEKLIETQKLWLPKEDK